MIDRNKVKNKKFNKLKNYQINKGENIQQNSRIVTIGNAIIIFIGIHCAIFLPIYFSGINIYAYDEDLVQRIPFIKKELIVYGKYDKNIVNFETNYSTKLNYVFPENTPIEDIAKFTKENVGQITEIRIENIQSAYLNTFNIKVQ